MTTVVDRADEIVNALRRTLSGPVALPGEPGYELATPWNVAVAVKPRAVIVANTAEDIARTVHFAAAHSLRVAVQRTGHGALPVGDDVLLVHTGRLDECTVDAETRTARVGAGVIWQQVIDAATPHGLAPLAGSATSVGVVGFLTGGGIGPFVRTVGASSDHVRAFEVVTGEGQLLRATPDEHAELYWGLRGGKGTLGIVTAVEIDLLPISEFYGGAVYFDGSDAAAVAHAWRDWCRQLPEHVNTSLALLQLPPLPQVPPPLAGRLTVAIRFTSTAEPEVAERILAPIRAAARVIIDAVGPMPYAAIGAVHADPVDPTPTYEHSELLRELPADAVDAILTHAGPESNSPLTMVELRLLGGAFARIPEHPSALSHRDAPFNLTVIGVLAPPVAALVPAHAGRLVTVVEPWSTGRQLPNFAPSADWGRLSRCYDEDTLHWLGTLGDQHDPAGVLRVGQVVRIPR